MEFIIEHGRLVQYIGNSRRGTIPEGIEYIDFLAFAYSPVEHVIFPESLEGVDSYAFRGSALKEVSFPKFIFHIETHAFEGCRQLRKVWLPICFNRIEEESFAHCHHLKQVDLYGTALGLPQREITIDETAFRGCHPEWSHDNTFVSRLRWRWEKFRFRYGN